MPQPGVRWVLVCEDRKTETFARGVLEPIFGKRPQVVPLPNGRGSGAQWVVARYAKEMRKIRSTRPNENVALVVLVDGNSVGMAVRMRELADRLRADSQAPLSDGDRVAVLVPTWSIETWLYWLCLRPPLNESTAYKKDRGYLDAEERGEVSPKGAAAAWSPPHPDEATRLPALVAGRAQIDDLKARLRLK